MAGRIGKGRGDCRCKVNTPARQAIQVAQMSDRAITMVQQHLPKRVIFLCRR
ncbi:hypothetical protein CERZMDRAFT_89510 [Cercospora zeae-maydis SCOH1-5]|uniref:Uncharacterized protein n=1 Tax=Cercospora zeae-maydis SCOH1-5 TaxID=717836 RepID=A0A6A6FVC4_9PEZI|nr:hypothetical protein CERZMDRAFT_89510 [Cercospora zeae-maydis SCOH1-5]